MYSRKIKAIAGATDPAGVVAETGVGIALAGGAGATIAAHKIMSAAGIRGLAIINVVEMLTGRVIATGVRETANVAAMQTDLVSAITAMPVENAVMMALEMRNVSGRQSSATKDGRTDNVSGRLNNVISVVAMRLMQTDPAVGMAAHREEDVAMIAQVTSNVSGRQGRGINAGLTASVIGGALIVAQTGVGMLIVMAVAISADRIAALMAAGMHIGKVVEINDGRIVAPTVAVTPIETGAETSAARIVAQTADATLIETVAVTSAVLIDASIAGIPIVRGVATSGG